MADLSHLDGAWFCTRNPICNDDVSLWFDICHAQWINAKTMACLGQRKYFNEMYLHRIFYWSYFYQYQVPSIVRSLLTKYNVLNTFGCILWVYFTRFSSIVFYRKCFLDVEANVSWSLSIQQDVCQCDRNEILKSRTVTQKSNKECNYQSVYSVVLKGIKGFYVYCQRVNVWLV